MTPSTDLNLAMADVRRLTETRRYNEALRLTSELIGTYPDSAEPYFRRALVLFALKQQHAAIDDLTSAISKNSGEPALFYFRGMWRIEGGLVDPGLEDMGEAIALESHLESSYYSHSARLCRAVAYYQRHEAGLALRELQGLRDSTTIYLVGRVWNVTGLRHELTHGL